MNEHELTQVLEQARTHVTVGQRYHHYRDRQLSYTVHNLVLDEATQKVMVLYQAEYGKRLIWVRALDVWSEFVEHNGQKVPRFSKVTHEQSGNQKKEHRQCVC
jgi:hypothetical protein